MVLESVTTFFSENKLYVGIAVVVVVICVAYFMWPSSTHENKEGGAPSQDQSSATKKVILFYSPNCPHCNKLTKEDNSSWKQYVKNNKTRKDLIIEEIDCLANPDAVEKNNLDAYPTLRLYSGDKVTDYDGDFSLQSLEQFSA